MGLRLSVRRTAWLHSVDTAADQRPGLIPVVKGNGYGFGRPALMPIAARLCASGHSPTGQIAVGTVYEAVDVPDDRVPLVLTPHVDAIPAGVASRAVLTVGNVEHVSALQRHGWVGAVAIKLASSMQRYGVLRAELDHVAAAARRAGLTVAAFGIHLPLAGSDESRAAEVTSWLADLDPDLPVSLSHVGPAGYAALRSAHPDRTLLIRCGTALWHADKTLVHLTADVLDVRPVAAGSVAGYRASPIADHGHLILVAAGSTHGVHALPGGLSPFHFARQRLTLLEAPHMHTSMLFVPDGAPVPAIGERVDVQRPLIETHVDELEWRDD